MRYLKGILFFVISILFAAILLDVPVPGFEAEGMSRDIYFKLPLEQPRFHWRFTDKDAFLAGRLTLRIISTDGRHREILVFDRGSIAEGWSEIGGPRTDGSIYFGFSSTTEVLTASRDSIEVELIVLEDLDGIGAWSEGVLPAGRYTASASHSILTGKRWFDWITREDDPTAYIGCWHRTWHLQITKNEGWRGRQEEDGDLSLLRRILDAGELLFSERGTDGTRCLKG